MPEETDKSIETLPANADATIAPSIPELERALTDAHRHWSVTKHKLSEITAEQGKLSTEERAADTRYKVAAEALRLAHVAALAKGE